MMNNLKSRNFQTFLILIVLFGCSNPSKVEEKKSLPNQEIEVLNDFLPSYIKSFNKGGIYDPQLKKEIKVKDTITFHVYDTLTQIEVTQQLTDIVKKFAFEDVKLIDINNSYFDKNSLLFPKNMIPLKFSSELKGDFIIGFSHVYFNMDKDKGVIVVDVHRGKSDSWSDLILLKKMDNGWQIFKRNIIRIS